MVQIVDMQNPPSMGAMFGRGLGQGISSGVSSMLEEKRQERSMGLQYKLSDMLDAKKASRTADREGAKGVSLLKLMLPKKGKGAPTQEELQLAYSGGTDVVVSYLEQKEAARYRDARRGGVNNKPDTSRITNNQQNLKSPEITGITPPKSIQNIQALPQQPQSPMYNPQYDQQAQAMGLPNVGPGGLNIGLPGRLIPTAIPNAIPQYTQQPVGQELPQAPVSGVTQQMPLPTTPGVQPPTGQAGGWKEIYDMTESEFNDFLSKQQLSIKDLDKLTTERNEGIKRKQEARKIELEELENARKAEVHALAMEEAPKEIQPYITEMRDRRAALRNKQRALLVAENAIRSGNTSGIIQFLAHKHGLDPLKTTDTAILESSAKEFLMSNIGRAGTRPNQWLEQQISSMFMQPGRSTESNILLTELYKNDADQENRELDIFDRLVEEDIQKYGRPRRDLQKRVDSELKPYVEEKNNELSNRIQEVKESNMSDKQINSMVKVPEGTPLTPRKKYAILEHTNQDKEAGKKLAAKLGYRVYKTKPSGV